MTLYVAWNCALPITTGMSLGTSYAAGAKVAVQLATPAGTQIRLVEWGVSFNGSAGGAPAVCELVQVAAASTVTAHSTTTVQPIGDNANPSGLTYSTTTTGYGAATITTTTTEKVFDSIFLGPTGVYVMQWPLGREPMMIPSKFAQLRINTAATLTALAYVMFEEC